MKKYLLLFVCCMLMVCGCENNGKPKLSELSPINDAIIAYFQAENPEYNNYVFNYVDEKSRTVVVGLLNNTKEEQDRFRQLVVDSEYLVFQEADYNYNHD